MSRSLSDLVKLQRGTTYKSSLLGQPGPVLLGLASISPNGGFKKSSLKTYGGSSPEKLILAPGDMYVSLKDVTQSANLLGAVSRVPQDISEGRLTQDTVQLIFTDSRISQDYIYWLLRTPQYRTYCRLRANGTTNLSLSREDFLSFPVPEFNTQRALLVQLLQALEDKIELNRRMNETLEEMARALFKSWFVDFDPVRAKMEGRQPAGMDDETAALFPDSFEDSALGEIPKGWSIASIGEAVKVVGGGTPSTKESSFWDGGVHCWATPKDLSKLQSSVLLDTERKVTDAGLAKISSGLLPVGTVLLSSRAPVGYLAVARVPMAVNQGFIAMLCDGPLTTYYVLHWARINVERIKGRAGGTTFPEISKKNFRPMSVLVPPDEVLFAFEKQEILLYDRMSANLRQSATLAAIRGTLLPKLLSGEVRVGEAEEVVEEAL
jgi:restriction endonuclease S subunit